MSSPTPSADDDFDYVSRLQTLTQKLKLPLPHYVDANDSCAAATLTPFRMAVEVGIPGSEIHVAGPAAATKKQARQQAAKHMLAQQQFQELLQPSPPPSTHGAPSAAPAAAIVAAVDHISRLNLRMQAQHSPVPAYTIVAQEGPAHMTRFTLRVSCTAPDGSAMKAVGDPARSCAQAKQNAAMAVLSSLDALAAQQAGQQAGQQVGQAGQPGVASDAVTLQHAGQTVLPSDGSSEDLTAGSSPNAGQPMPGSPPAAPQQLRASSLVSDLTPSSSAVFSQQWPCTSPTSGPTPSSSPTAPLRLLPSSSSAAPQQRPASSPPASSQLPGNSSAASLQQPPTGFLPASSAASRPIVAVDHVSYLNSLMQAQRFSTPTYVVVCRSGPPHVCFAQRVSCTGRDGATMTAVGAAAPTLAEAKQNAAAAILPSLSEYLLRLSRRDRRDTSATVP